MVLCHKRLYLHRPQHHLLTIDWLQAPPSDPPSLHLPCPQRAPLIFPHAPSLFLSPHCSRFNRDSFTPSSQYLEKPSIAFLTPPNRETGIYTIRVTPPSL